MTATLRGRMSRNPHAARALPALALSTLLLAAAPALAEAPLDSVQRQLAQQGYAVTEVHRTLLGRIRITSRSRGLLRETVMAANGTVLRDVVTKMGQGSGETTQFLEAGKSDGASSGGAPGDSVSRAAGGGSSDRASSSERGSSGGNSSEGRSSGGRSSGGGSSGSNSSSGGSGKGSSASSSGGGNASGAGSSGGGNSSKGGGASGGGNSSNGGGASGGRGKSGG